MPRPTFPGTLPEATGPLPHGWHRLTFRKKGFIPDAPPLHVVSSDIGSIVLLEVTLEAASDVVPGSIVRESWSDFPPTIRP